MDGGGACRQRATLGQDDASVCRQHIHPRSQVAECELVDNLVVEFMGSNVIRVHAWKGG